MAPVLVPQLGVDPIIMRQKKECQIGVRGTSAYYEINVSYEYICYGVCTDLILLPPDIIIPVVVRWAWMPALITWDALV